MLNVPQMYQLTDNLTNGAPDPNAPNQCGEECIAMIGSAFGYGGPTGFTAGDIRVILRGGNYQGQPLTTAQDLVNGLQLCFEIPSHARLVDGATMQIEVTRAVAAGMPPIILGNWVSPDVPHWNVVRAADAAGIWVNDPILGTVQHPWSWVLPRYDGSYVHVDRALP